MKPHLAFMELPFQLELHGSNGSTEEFEPEFKGIKHDARNRTNHTDTRALSLCCSDPNVLSRRGSRPLAGRFRPCRVEMGPDAQNCIARAKGNVPRFCGCLHGLGRGSGRSQTLKFLICLKMSNKFGTEGRSPICGSCRKRGRSRTTFDSSVCSALALCVRISTS